MSAENWLQRASGLVVPARNLAGPWRFLPCPDCCSELGDPCGLCDTATTPAFLELTVSGVTNGTCIDCSFFNGVHILAQRESPFFCAWGKFSEVHCPSLEFAAVISAEWDGSLLSVNLQVAGPSPGGFGKYDNPFGVPFMSTDCSTWEDVELTKWAESDGGCQTWPDTITVSSI